VDGEAERRGAHLAWWRTIQEKLDGLLDLQISRLDQVEPAVDHPEEWAKPAEGRGS